MADRHKPQVRVVVGRFFCPPLFCGGTGRWPSGERCMNCAGTGMLTERPAPEWGSAAPVPRPPGVMRTPCGGCAYRPGSPEREGGPLPGEEGGPAMPFWCHKGLPHAEGEYRPPAELTIGPYVLPLGALVCAGYWFTVTGQGTAHLGPFTDDAASDEARTRRALPPPGDL